MPRIQVQASRGRKQQAQVKTADLCKRCSKHVHSGAAIPTHLRPHFTDRRDEQVVVTNTNADHPNYDAADLDCLVCKRDLTSRDG